MMAMVNLSDAAKILYARIGTGMILCIEHSSGKGSLVNAPTHPTGFPDCLVDTNAARELLEGFVLHRLAKDREGSRNGWQEIGLDGSHADFWVHIQ